MTATTSSASSSLSELSSSPHRHPAKSTTLFPFSPTNNIGVPFFFLFFAALVVMASISLVFLFDSRVKVEERVGEARVASMAWSLQSSLTQRLAIIESAITSYHQNKNKTTTTSISSTTSLNNLVRVVNVSAIASAAAYKSSSSSLLQVRVDALAENYRNNNNNNYNSTAVCVGSDLGCQRLLHRNNNNNNN
eukprot:PhM_4_TR15622/c0_g1_i1/m.10527